jgi:formiminotetrahydrofolate cyclodeaminase
MRDQTIETYLDSLAARQPAPGGGTAAALHLAQGAALVGMVARYSTGEKYREHAAAIERVISSADAARESALELAAADAAAFTGVTDAYRLPHDSEADKDARSQAIAVALARAAEPPADLIDLSRHVLELAETLLPAANRNVITDIGAAAEAVRAAAATSRLNIEINVGGVTDPAALARCAAALEGVEDVLIRAEKITSAIRDVIK